jgi:hypothetical protein
MLARVCSRSTASSSMSPSRACSAIHGSTISRVTSGWNCTPQVVSPIR